MLQQFDKMLPTLLVNVGQGGCVVSVVSVVSVVWCWMLAISDKLRRLMDRWIK
jgi:hypothetical protein